MVIVTYHHVTFISTAVQKKKEDLDLAQVESVSTKEQGTMTFLDWFSIFLVFHHSNKGFFFTFIEYYLFKGNKQRKKKRNKEKKRKKKARKKAQKKSASSPGKKTRVFFCIYLNIYLNCVSVDVAEEIMSKGKFLESWVTSLLRIIHLFVLLFTR